MAIQVALNPLYLGGVSAVCGAATLAIVVTLAGGGASVFGGGGLLLR